MPDKQTLVEQQSDIIDKLQREALSEGVVYEPELMRCLTQAIDKYATLAHDPVRGWTSG